MRGEGIVERRGELAGLDRVDLATGNLVDSLLRAWKGGRWRGWLDGDDGWVGGGD